MDKAFVSGYKIIRQVGEGGMAVVYLAQHRDVPEHKVIMKELKDSNLAARFLKEASHLARLDHPRICPIFHFFTEEGRTFILMKYVEGETLKESLDRRGSLSISESLRITTDLLDALSYAHKRKIYHRDIKPSNIMIDSEGHTMVIDFGIAKSEEDPDMTQEGSFCGTPHFAPPEQFYSVSTIDWALADIYALGVTLFLLVTGEYPFSGQTWMEIAESKRSTNPPKPSAKNKTVPAQLDRLVLSALSRDPRKRYQSAADMLRALVEVQKEIPTSTEEDMEYTRTVLSQTKLADKPRRKLLWPALAVAAALSLITLGGYFMYTLGYFPGSAGKARVDKDRIMLAVLPFENLGAPDTKYFAEGITEEITSKLARIKGLGVISRSSAIKYKASDKTVQEIGAELGVSFILTGSIRWDRSGEMSEVRITAQLIRVSDDTYIWSNTYQEELTQVFTVQSDIATNIINELDVILLAPERQALRAIPTDNLSAYDFYLKGKESFNRSWSKEDIEYSIEMNQRAVAIDSTFALAYVSLSRGHESMYWEFYDRSPERLTLAKQAALRSLELQPLLAEGHLALGYFYYHGELDYARALDEFKLALEQQPNSSDLLNALGAVHRREGKFEEALGDFMQASQFDPRSHLILFDIGLTFSMLRRYEEAEVFMKRAMEMAPDWPLPLIYRAWVTIFRTGDIAEASVILQQAPEAIDLTRSRYYWWLARIINPDYEQTLQTMTLGSDTVEFFLQCAQFNRLLARPELEFAYADSARIFLEQSMLDQPQEPRFLSHLGLAYAGLRQKERAITEARRAVELLPTSKEAFDALFLVLNLTEVLVIFGEHEAAIQQLEFMMSIPGFVSAPYLAQDPLWKPLHKYPKFQQLLQTDSVSR